MTDPARHRLMMESTLDLILEDLSDVGDEDRDHTAAVLTRLADEMEGFATQRPQLVAAIRDWVASGVTAGELRRTIRRTRAEIAEQQ